MIKNSWLFVWQKRLATVWAEIIARSGSLRFLLTASLFGQEDFISRISVLIACLESWLNFALSQNSRNLLKLIRKNWEYLWNFALDFALGLLTLTKADCEENVPDFFLILPYFFLRSLGYLANHLQFWYLCCSQVEAKHLRCLRNVQFFLDKYHSFYKIRMRKR